MVKTTHTDGVAVLTMAAQENRFNPTMLDSFNAALDDVEASPEVTAVVLTGEDKFFSNGLDLDWMTAAPDGGAAMVVGGLQALYIRLLTLPVPVVAAVNGHAFAGGAMLALACDERVMREDRGYFCLPEVDINIAFVAGMASLIQCKLTPASAHQAMLSGRRYGGPEAVACGIANAAVGEDLVVCQATERAVALSGKSRPVVQAIKQVMYRDTIAALALMESF